MINIEEKLKNSRVFLYGAGNIGMNLFKFLKNQINVCGFLDIKSTKDSIDGIKVYNPFIAEIEKENSFVIVSIFNREINFESIKEQLNEVGFKEVVSFIEFFPYFAEKNQNWYWLSNNLEYLDKRENIESVYQLLGDKMSQDIFNSTIHARRNFSFSMLPKPYPIIEQYFSKDIPLNQFDNFIDCGAYNGDTFDVMIDKNIDFKKIYAFEPDLINFVDLANKIKKSNKKAILYPCGVYSKNEMLSFGGGAGEGSAISVEGSIHIQCVSLDDVFVNELTSSTYLKMDIEGAELEALKGGKKLIEQIKPDLAICVYHKPDDIITIPLFINSLGKFTFYLRQYGYYGMELVLYAIRK